MHDELTRRLALLDTCAVSDALDRCGLDGAVLGLHQLTVPRRFAGRAVTVKLVAAPEGGAPKRHLCTAAIESADPGDVIVVDAGGRDWVAGWGGLLSLAASRRGVAGVVVDGAVRDVDEARDLALPVLARAAVPVTARGRVVEESTNTPVSVAGVGCQPGDLVLADSSGAVIVPAGRAAEVIAAAEAIAGREALMADDVRRGRPITEVLGAGYETMLSSPDQAGRP